MESRIKGRVLAIIVAGAMIASTSTVFAATATPSPKPTVKATAKAAPKPTPKPSVRAKKRTATKKPVIRKPSPQKVIYKRKVVKASPSPSPVWPPRTPPFVNPQGSEIYYKIPKPNELMGALSAIAALATEIKPCTKFACGVVTLASTNGCTWWEIDSRVYGPLTSTDPSPVPYGDLVTTVKGTDKRKIITVLLVSTEPLKKNVYVAVHDVSCHHDPVTTSPQKVPSNIYTVYTPTPTPTPSASASNVAVINTN